MFQGLWGRSKSAEADNAAPQDAAPSENAAAGVGAFFSGLRSSFQPAASTEQKNPGAAGASADGPTENNKAHVPALGKSASDAAVKVGSFFSSIATSLADKARESREQFLTERAKYATPVQEPQTNSPPTPSIPPPWHISGSEGKKFESELRERILTLSTKRATFFDDPPEESEYENFELDVYLPLATRFIALDENLNKARFTVVPRRLKDEVFWRNYFYHVDQVRALYGLPPCRSFIPEPDAETEASAGDKTVHDSESSRKYTSSDNGLSPSSAAHGDDRAEATSTAEEVSDRTHDATHKPSAPTAENPDSRASNAGNEENTNASKGKTDFCEEEESEKDAEDDDALFVSDDPVESTLTVSSDQHGNDPRPSSAAPSDGREEDVVDSSGWQEELELQLGLLATGESGGEGGASTSANADVELDDEIEIVEDGSEFVEGEADLLKSFDDELRRSNA